MATYKERFQADLEKILERVLQLSQSGFQDSVLRDLITGVGIRTEIFLKTAVLPNLPPKAELGDCINALKAHGVDKVDRRVLHELRDLYNNCKHTPRYRPSLLALQDLIPKIMNVVHRLAAQNLGRLNSPETMQHKHVLWLAAWDHYIGGDTEVHVIVPAATGDPPDLDLIYIEMSSWEEVKGILSNLGSVRNGSGVIPAKYLNEFAAEADFHEAIVFEGDFRALIATLAAHERREDLIPGLRREDDVRSMAQAFALAAVDVATSEDLSSADLARAIAERAVDTYAVPANFRLLDRYAGDFRLILGKLSPEERKLLNGPTWVSLKDFRAAEPSSLAKHSSLNVLINSESTVLLC